MQPIKDNKTLRTFDDFVHHAQRAYGDRNYSHENFLILKARIEKKLESKGLLPIDVVCYINWCDNEYFTQTQIALKLKLSQQLVAHYINRLRKVWPWLPSHPHAKGQRRSKRRGKEFGCMKKLDKETINSADIRMKW